MGSDSVTVPGDVDKATCISGALCPSSEGEALKDTWSPGSMPIM